MKYLVIYIYTHTEKVIRNISGICYFHQYQIAMQHVERFYGKTRLYLIFLQRFIKTAAFFKDQNYKANQKCSYIESTNVQRPSKYGDPKP